MIYDLLSDLSSAEREEYYARTSQMIEPENIGSFREVCKMPSMDNAIIKDLSAKRNEKASKMVAEIFLSAK